ncbi:MAG: DUF2905 domain-containing protein [Polyangiaceae bacterium]
MLGSPPPTPPSAGPLLVGVGVLIVVVGLLLWTGALNWFGKLPGDIRYESGSTRVYVPWVSMLLVSALFSLVGLVARRFH